MKGDRMIAWIDRTMNIFEDGWNLAAQCYPNNEMTNRPYWSTRGSWWVWYDWTTLTRHNTQWCIVCDDGSDAMRDNTRPVINDERITTNTRSSILCETVMDGFLIDWYADRCLLSLNALCYARVRAKSSAIAEFEQHEQSSITGPYKWLSECWSCHRLTTIFVLARCNLRIESLSIDAQHARHSDAGSFQFFRYHVE